MGWNSKCEKKDDAALSWVSYLKIVKKEIQLFSHQLFDFEGNQKEE
jgi:hypothetical protein